MMSISTKESRSAISWINEVFIDRPCAKHRFRSSTWSEVGIVDHLLASGELLENFLRLIDARERIAVANIESIPRFEELFIVEPKTSELSSAYFDTTISHFDHVVCPESKGWGVFCSAEHYSVFGGSRELASKLEHLLGGKSEAVTCFREHVSELKLGEKRPILYV